MIVQKFQPDEEWLLRISKCVAIIWIGVQEDIPTVIAVVAEEGERSGKDFKFYFKTIGDKITSAELQQQNFVAALVTTTNEYLMYKETSSIVESFGEGPMPPGMFSPGRPPKL